MKIQSIKKQVGNYYAEKLNYFGKESPFGVDWNSIESQELRFKILSEIIEEKSDSHFTILDYGCGTGDYLKYLSKRYNNFEYTGYDLAEEMINAAK